MREMSTRKPSGGEHPTGESQNPLFQLSFNRFLRVDFQGSWVTSDGVLLHMSEALGELHITVVKLNAIFNTRLRREAWKHRLILGVLEDRGLAPKRKKAKSARQRAGRMPAVRNAKAKAKATGDPSHIREPRGWIRDDSVG